MLSVSQYEWLRWRVSSYLPQDTHSEKSGFGYPVISAYFDTPSLDCFYQKINGEYNHIKFRIRSYCHSFDQARKVFLEIKSKQGEAQTKLRIPLDFSPKLFQPINWWLIDDYQIAECLINYPHLEYICNVYYERDVFEGYHYECGKIRINFDANILAMPKYQPHGPPEGRVFDRLIPHNHLICEIKTENGLFPDFLKNELRCINAHQVRISKYAESVLSLNQQHLIKEIST